MQTHLTALLFLLPLLSNALPAQDPNSNPNAQSQTQNEIQITPKQIETIAPKSKSCDSAPSKDECATAAQAAPAISASFNKYKVHSRAEQAAVIGLMAFESGDFKSNRNHSPGVPGQGTRNMQSPTYNQKYAASLPDIADAAKQASDADKVLDLLVKNKEYDFGSGAWFLTTQCEEDVRKRLQSGSEEGWKAYIRDCVGTEANGERREYWERAVNALG
ncbi:hypothetical protein P168DRAFT_311024 [Aspergillus campestris IBT 28561]|uniref:Lysozyme-like protein n=1 Tax=Aspergillus campestris (strain IBT 28561) TaxID=1392248 RepID=A0A2I1D3M6_ASPC2|nr:uncharacterized protein P168DRAFT_311024 [Aspergillus campestris IBT 28561]PKY04474.1 hypothetical protein P168DRAFT_311024 [Aspergillus campestris IBT 28561]